MENAGDASTCSVLARLRELSDDAEFFQDIAKVFSRHKHFDHALAAFELSMQLDPCDGFTHLYLGNWYYREKQYEVALERFEYACELMPELAVSYWCVADVYEALGNFQAAREWHQRGMAAEPSSSAAKKNFRQFVRRRRWREDQP